MTSTESKAYLRALNANLKRKQLEEKLKEKKYENVTKKVNKI